MRTTFFLFLKKSFYVRMSLIMLTLSLAPLIVLAVIAVNIANKSVETQVNQINYQVIGQVTERIELTMRKLQEMGYQYTSLSIIEDVLSDEGTPYQQVQKKKDLIASMNSTSAALADIDGVYLYSTQTDSVLSTKDALTSLAFSRYKHLLEDFKNSTTSLTFVDRSFTYAGGKAVAFMRRIPFEQFEDLKGIFMVTVPYEVFQKLIQNIDLGNLGSITILSRDGDIIATTSRLSTAQATDRVKALLMKWNQDSSKTQFIWDDSLISIKPTSTLDKWLVYTEIPSQELTKDTAAIARSVRYILYVLLVLGFILVLSFGYYLYKPLQKVRRLLEAIKQSNFTAKEQFHSSNEIGEIGIMLNSLGGKMQSLIHELQETADLKRRNEIRALQAQINPHFLYNSLNTIRMFAMLKDYGKINELMGRLIALLRYSMENYEQAVTVRRELDYLADYISLLELRYERTLTLESHVDKHLEAMLIPKLLLQPLIENAIFHGILPLKEAGHIRIDLRESPCGQNFLLEVSDNGKGIEEQRLLQIRQELARQEATDRIGLKNVYERIKFYWGEDTQIQITSQIGQGTHIRFTALIKQHQ